MQPLVRKRSGVALSRFFLLGGAILLILPLYPFTAISAVLSGSALFLAAGEAPSRNRTLTLAAAVVLLGMVILLTLLSLQTGTIGPHGGEVLKA
ncbi:hypothetical protein [Arthrobacter bambusae]|uniref:hypothetical protein n=1 Tax=Arthrobacter bambusae TaxID=1338426 RepID=UPI002787A1CA|nr:hypothetical protein [Arthrobacter bambusae]MDQ0029590.1 hypothetical protein [Arthrobacter bambusae]MDQ0097250.1 hypothetical protein [Arthrobacter bambusae]